MQENMAVFQTWVLFLELRLKESTLNEQDRCCSPALMVVFQCAAERSVHGSFVKRPASACCQAPLVLLITHDKVMVKWGQLGRAETAWMEGGWWICVRVLIWSFPHMRLYAAEQTRLKAAFSHFYGANSVAANGHTNTQASWRTTGSTKSTCCFLGEFCVNSRASWMLLPCFLYSPILEHHIYFRIYKTKK